MKTQCITLAAVVTLKAEVASDEDKEALARSLLYLGKSPSGSVKDDILQLALEIKEWVVPWTVGYTHSISLQTHRHAGPQHRLEPLQGSPGRYSSNCIASHRWGYLRCTVRESCQVSRGPVLITFCIL